jgi:hypothetical protein
MESGRILVRQRPAGQGAPWGPAQELDPAETAPVRAPRAWDGVLGQPIRLGFVRSAPGGDEIHVWELRNGAWSDFAYPILTGGPVAFLDFRSVDGAPMVTWIDADGHVFHRLMNGDFY